MRFSVLMVLRAVLMAGVSTHAVGGTFSDDFSTGINSNYWSTSTNKADGSVLATGKYTFTGANGVATVARIANQSNPNSLEWGQLSLNLASLGGPISGAFQMQVDFSGAALNPGPGSTLDQVQFNAWFSANASPTLANSSHLLDVYDNDVNLGGRNVHIWNANAVHSKVNTAATSGTLQLSRDANNLVTGSILIGGSQVTSFSQTINTPLWLVTLTLQNNRSSTFADSVSFDNFSLTAATVPAVPEPEQWTLMVLGMSLVGLVARRRGRRALQRCRAAG